MVDTILTIKNGKVVKAFHNIERVGWIEEKLPDNTKESDSNE